MGWNSDDRRPSHPSALRRLVALSIVVAIPFGLMIWIRVHQTTGFAAIELIVYPLLFGGSGIVILWLLKRFYLGERVRDLSAGKGRWGTDILWGFALAAAYFLLFSLERLTLADLLAFRSNTELLGLMLDMRQHAWMTMLWFGPVLWIGIALYEELVRTFLLVTLWSFSNTRWWAVLVIVLAAVVVGLTHWSQGPYGIVTIALKGLLTGIVYFKQRRLLPLVVAHAVYDGVQVGLLLLTYPG